jgi:hypothetical protein
MKVIYIFLTIQLLVFLAVNANDLTMIEAIYTQYPWTMDLGSVVMPSWLLFWASDSFRAKIMDDFVPTRSWKGIFKNLKVSPIPAGVNIARSTMAIKTIQVQSHRRGLMDVEGNQSRSPMIQIISDRMTH